MEKWGDIKQKMKGIAERGALRGGAAWRGVSKRFWSNHATPVLIEY